MLILALEGALAECSAALLRDGAVLALALHDAPRGHPTALPSMAQQVLGDGAVITGVDGNYFSWMPGRADNAYVVTLEGPKGEGQLAVSGHTALGGAKIDSAILTGPDGQRYDLLKRQRLPGNDSRVIDNSI
jgi:hypothetical protein